jgi:hypothetical protein
VEANTSHNPAVSRGRLSGRSGLRGRLASLVTAPRRNGAGASKGKADEATVRFDHFVGESQAIVLHHRRLPGSRSEISHLLVGPAGVTVVDSHRYNSSGVKIDARGAHRIVRARSGLAKGVLEQAAGVRELLADTPYAAVPIDAAVARSKVAGPRVLQSLNGPRVIVSGVRTIATEASREGDLSSRRVKGLARYLDETLD